jgi:hypothetical protein
MKLKKLRKDPYKNEYDYIRHKFLNELPPYTEVNLYQAGNRVYFTDQEDMKYTDESMFKGAWLISSIQTSNRKYVAMIDIGLEERQVRLFQYTSQDIYDYRKSGTESRDELFDFEEYIKRVE